MSGDPTLLAGLLLYLVGMLAVGLAARRSMRSLDDYLLAGRRLGPWVCAISERASGESAWFLLGLPGAAYALGFTEYWSVIGIALGILASWTFIAIPLRRATARLGALTLPDYFEARFGDRSRLLRLVSMLAILVFYTAYVAAQFVGAGKILHASFGIDPRAGMLIGAVVVVLYTLIGGFLAVAWTDLVQGLLMMATAVLLPIAGIVALGGPAALIDKLAPKGPAFLSMDGGQVGHAFVFGVVVGGLSWGLGYLGQPHLLVRYMAIRRTSELRQSSLIAMGWTLLSYWGAPLIGIVGLAVIGPGLADPDQVMPLLAKTLLPGWLAGLMIAGATAAMMSTVDSQLLVVTSTLVEDVYVRMFGRVTGQQRLVTISRVVTLLVAAVAFAFAWKAIAEGLRGVTSGATTLIHGMVAYAWTGIGAAFGPPLLFALWWSRTTRTGALAGMIGGIVSTIVWRQAPVLGQLLDIKAAAMLISAILVVTVSLVTSPPREVRQV